MGGHGIITCSLFHLQLHKCQSLEVTEHRSIHVTLHPRLQARPGAVIPELSQTPDSQTPSLLSPAVNQAPDDVHQQMTQGQGQEQQGKGDPDEHGQQEQEREAHSASATKAAHPPTAAQHTLAPLAEDTPMPPEALAVAAPAEEGHGNGGGGGGVCSSKRSTAEDPARASFDGSVVSEGPGGHDRRASRAQTCKTDATTVAGG